MPDDPPTLDEGGDQFRALRTADERTLIFNPLGIGGRLEPEQALSFLSLLLKPTALHSDVPENVARTFERLRLLFKHGVLEYEFFTAADDAAYLVLEGALRHRFVTFYEHEIPVFIGGLPETIPAPTFDAFREAVSALRSYRHHPRLNESGRSEPLPLTLSRLWTWARRCRLLVGQRNTLVFKAMTEMRNSAAHPERYRLVMPSDAIRTLRDTAEIINRLWGHDTEGGRLFPTPAPRRYRCAAISDDGTHALTFGSLQTVPLEQNTEGWTYAIYLAADREDLTAIDWGCSGRQGFAHEPNFQRTELPVELVWGPGSHSELVAELPRFMSDEPVDYVGYLDRTFFIRTTDEQVDLPRSAADVIAFSSLDEGAVWHLVRADYPLDAFAHVRDRRSDHPDGHTNVTEIRQLIGDNAARSAAFAIARGEKTLSGQSPAATVDKAAGLYLPGDSSGSPNAMS